MNEIVEGCDHTQEHNEGHDKTETVRVHVFANASNLVCCMASIVAVEYSSRVLKDLLTSKFLRSLRETSI